MRIKNSKSKQNFTSLYLQKRPSLDGVLLLRCMASVFTYTCLLCVRVYQSFLSVYFSGQCRFIPSCSNYCAQSFQQHKPFKALLLTFLRVIKCQPFYQGCAYDPVPLNKNKKHSLVRAEDIKL